MQNKTRLDLDKLYLQKVRKNQLSDMARRTPGRRRPLKKTKSLKISQCMIVKNEEKNIRQALSWGKDMMWEQIVVDTGSMDRTAEIARELGAKLFSYEWTDNFAAAKNYAISQAEGDWIALLDADEYMVQEDVEKLQQVLMKLEEKHFDALSTAIQNLNDEGQIFSSGTQVRFFRNDPDIRYRRRIHEQLEAVSGRKLRIGDVTRELSIFHTGYQKKALEGKEKNGRNQKLILAELEENPDDYEMMGYMGDDCLANGEKEIAETWYRRSIQHMPPYIENYDQRSAVTFTELLRLLTEKEELLGDGAYLGEITDIYNKAVLLLPEEPDFDYVLGRFFAVKNEMGKALHHLEKALEKFDTYGSYNKAMLLAVNLLDVYELLVRCCYTLGKQEKCISYAVNYLKFNPYGMEVLYWFYKILLPEGNPQANGDAQKQAVLEVLSKIYDFRVLKNKLFCMKTAEKAVGKDFSLFLLNRLFSPEEQKQLGW